MVESVDKKSIMEYRYLGNTGMKVSVLGFGNMVNHINDDPQKNHDEIISKLLEWGVNFFDTAETYSYGKAETYLGQSFKNLNIKREDIVVTTKLFFGTDGLLSGKIPTPNHVGLSRKHIVEGTKASLKRLQLDYVDVIYAHRYDCETPLEEVVRAFSWVIDQGHAFYWGTSEWTADQITEAITYARAHGLHAPVTEQPQYNMLHRERFEKEYETVFGKFNYGSTVWSPLASGILTGRYNNGELAEGRYTTPSNVSQFKDLVWETYFSAEKKEKNVKAL